MIASALQLTDWTPTGALAGVVLGVTIGCAVWLQLFCDGVTE